MIKPRVKGEAWSLGHSAKEKTVINFGINVDMYAQQNIFVARLFDTLWPFVQFAMETIELRGK